MKLDPVKALLGTLLVAGLASPCAMANNDQDENDIKNAIIRFKAGIAANPNNPQTRLSLGRAYLTSGDIAGAEESSKRQSS